MSEDFRNRKNFRLSNHDYQKPASYFITVNVRLGQCLFGGVNSMQEVELSELGKIARMCWLEIPNHFSNVEIDEFIIMPNHVHGIIHIHELSASNNQNSRLPGQPVRLPSGSHSNRFGPLPKESLGVIIGQYKAAVTRWANKNCYGGLFDWHTRYFDKIIHDEKALIAARTYIRQNPVQWWSKYQNSTW